MAKNSPGTLNSKTVRISLHTYLLLKEISEHSGSSIAEALDKLLLGSEHIPEILMPVVSATSGRVNAAMPAIVVAGVIPSQVAAGVMPRRVTTRIAPINPIIKLRVTVAKGGSTNGRAKQQV